MVVIEPACGVSECALAGCRGGAAEPVGAPGRRAISYEEIAAEMADEAPKHSRPTGAKSEKIFRLWQKPEFGFGDFLDIINPMHHIPIVATIYRNLSGDPIGAVPRVIGGALWGRLGGFVAGVVNAAVEWFTGKDIGDHIYAALFGGPAAGERENAVANSGTPPQPVSVLEAAAPTRGQVFSAPAARPDDDPRGLQPLSGRLRRAPAEDVHPALRESILRASAVLSYRRHGLYEKPLEPARLRLLG